MKEQDPIQAQLIEARRNQILDAATQVFAEKGFARATIKEIARVASIADGTIYIYFKNKNDLMLGLMHRLNQSDQRAEHFAEAEGSDPTTFSPAYFRQRLQWIEGQLPAMQAILQEVLGNEELRKEYYCQVIEPTSAVALPYFQHLVETSKIRPLDPALVIRLITSTTLGLLLLRMLGDPVVKESWEQLPEAAFEMIFKGLQSEPHA